MRHISSVRMTDGEPFIRERKVWVKTGNKIIGNVLILSLCATLFTGCAASGDPSDADRPTLEIETIPADYREGGTAGDHDLSGRAGSELAEGRNPVAGEQAMQEGAGTEGSTSGEAGTADAGNKGTSGEAGTTDAGNKGTFGEAGTTDAGNKGASGEAGTAAAGNKGTFGEAGTTDAGNKGASGAGGTTDAGNKGASGEAGTADAGNKDSSGAGVSPQDIPEPLILYKDNPSVGQLLLVRYIGGSSAVATYYQKDPSQTSGWSTVFETPAYVGKNGIGKTREGDKKTPIGDFGVRQAFGILPDPGTSLDFTRVTPTTYACEEEGPYYNRIIDTVETGHQCSSDGMYKDSPQYNYGIFIDYNPQNIYPLGSAIFVHCMGNKYKHTLGCVALPQECMKEVLITAKPGMRVIIG